MRTPRLVGTAVSLMILTAGLSACQDPNEPSPENTPALAGVAPTSTPVGHPAGKAGLRRMNRAQVLHALSAGPAKKKWAHVDMTIKAPSFSISGRGDMVYSRTTPAVRLEVAGSCLCYDNTEVVVKDHIYYFNIPALTGDRYTRLDPKAPGSPLGPDFAKISDELDALTMLLDQRPGFHQVHFTGHRQLYGHPMSSYRLVLDTKVGLAVRGLSWHPGKLPPKIVFNLWFDENHLLRKMIWKVNRIRMTSEMSDWGKHVRVDAPRPSQLVGHRALARTA
jgi:hypothetical protein